MKLSRIEVFNEEDKLVATDIYGVFEILSTYGYRVEEIYE